MTQQQRSVEEIGRRGQEIYDRQIRPHVEADNRGKFLVVDIETGDYEIADDDLTASDRAIAKNPDALLYGVRVGYATAYHFGGRRLTKPL